MNAAGEALTGFARAEALKSNFTRVVAPEYLQVAQDMLSRKAAGDIATAYELELISKDGRHVFV